MAESPSDNGAEDGFAESETREARIRREAFEANAWLAAIIDSSDDAILSKIIDGTIRTWNAGAERLFGFTAEEAIGKPITIIIPNDRRREEEGIIARLRAGERIERFETVRQHKDGSLIDVALTISPVKDAAGRVFGASKIARDITPAKQAAERQTLLLREMNHRIKNLFALTIGLITISARAADGINELAEDLNARLGALARAHALTLPDLTSQTVEHTNTTLVALLKAIVAPHEGRGGAQVMIEGEDAAIGPNSLPTIALLFHELATNAAKYGALALPEGRLRIRIAIDHQLLKLTWCEAEGPERDQETISEGFGSRLEKASLATLQGNIERTWLDRGLEIRLDVSLSQLNR